MVGQIARNLILAAIASLVAYVFLYLTTYRAYAFLLSLTVFFAVFLFMSYYTAQMEPKGQGGSKEMEKHSGKSSKSPGKSRTKKKRKVKKK